MTFARKKCGNASLNLLFLILSAPVESSWEKDLGFPKDQEEGEHVRRQLGERERERMRVISDLLALLRATSKRWAAVGGLITTQSFFSHPMSFITHML